MIDLGNLVIVALGSNTYCTCPDPPDTIEVRGRWDDEWYMRFTICVSCLGYTDRKYILREIVEQWRLTAYEQGLGRTQTFVSQNSGKYSSWSCGWVYTIF